MATGGAVKEKDDGWQDYAAPATDGEWQDAAATTPTEAPKPVGILDREIPLTSYGNATLSGLQSVGRGVRDAVTGLGTVIAHPIQTIKSFGELPSQIAQVPGAIRDINASPDPLGTYAKAAQETAGQGAGQAGLAIAAMGAPKALGAIRGTSVPARALQTVGRSVENFDVTKPFKSAGQIGEYWRQSSPLGRMISDTKQAVAEGRASALPTRVPTMRESPMTSPPPLRWNPVTKSMERVAPPPVRFNPKVAEPVSASVAPPPIKFSPKVAEPAPVAPPPIKFGAKAAEPEMVAPPPVRFSPKAEEAPTAKAPIPPVRWMKTPKGGVAPPITGGGAELPVRVPEPRTPFAGEQEGYMASVPREELGELAKTRKPGAGTQMQQLGKRIIYIPKEADYP